MLSERECVHASRIRRSVGGLSTALALVVAIAGCGGTEARDESPQTGRHASDETEPEAIDDDIEPVVLEPDARGEDTGPEALGNPKPEDEHGEPEDFQRPEVPRSTPPHTTPSRPRIGVVPRRGQATPSNGSVRGARLVYNGGRVLANVKVHAVFWGPSVSSVVTSQIGDFFRTVVASPYLDWLSEYNTRNTAVNGRSGTQQVIGRGSFAGQVTIRPTSTAQRITSRTVEQQLARSLGTGELSSPDPSSLYVVYFPRGMTITDTDGSASCDSWCGIHGAFPWQGQNVAYAIMPDYQDACSSGCGDNVDLSDVFNAITEVTSHELTEAITNPDVNLSETGQAALSWYDDTNGEIADICTDNYGTVGRFRVQAGWSNAAQSCIVQPQAQNDFSFTLPRTASVRLGSRVALLARTTLLSGRAGRVSLTAQTLPSGVSFTAPALTEGRSGNVTFRVASSARPGRFTITVVANGPTTRHLARVTLTITR